jgi:hypothetical protein
MEIKNAEVGRIGLIQQQDDGSIIQLGMSEEQSDMLQLLVASISSDKPLVKLPSKYNLIPKQSVCQKCKNKTH